ncbi:Serine/threonine-protein kinase domain protein [Cordyceps fumosorosea ARSEF 2679]|uniref:Serine/threonine-protein kinase domain protein n=1 Tax=Cordyceps fumosorosea (strain ARSEF 2679) TaxID=1081104 RepID=A0A168EMB0_CORFA|nr:Serine/threonine-protein kinase domain protein [Cordyceps fumosorosea ARSEF 2679]OAA73983.1 Serine/threonine-protein kinase domain protein [Cordyceps fumosorosea ARSEF 2679]
MSPSGEKSSLKRARVSLCARAARLFFLGFLVHHADNVLVAKGTVPDEPAESKKPRRSDRISAEDRDAPNGAAKDKTPVSRDNHLPSPLTTDATYGSSDAKELTPTPAGAKTVDETTPRKTEDDYAQLQALSSPPQDTQPVSQLLDKHLEFDVDAQDSTEEGVWGFLVPLDAKYGDKPKVLKKRCACPPNDSIKSATNAEKKDNVRETPPAIHEEEAYERTQIGGIASRGYLIGRHPECDVVVSEGVVSNRHCLIFTENNGNDAVAIVEDLSSNGTFVNEAIVGRNQRRELEDGDEIAVHGRARFVFRYPKSRHTSAFLQQYTLLQKLGKGHFAEVYLCIEKSTGKRFAVKIFTKTPGVDEKSKTEGLQQEIGMLMAVSHPNVLCLKDTFSERDRVYLVLELAPEGELFNYIVAKSKLSEDETRKLFKQLFHGIKYLHERNIVHRDIKPENILLVDKDLHVKLADFGLAKIIGEQSFTTTLCGTPSYVAPEILAESKQRKYTKAVDIWSLGVVLYICLCGFPPFSDELLSADFPYNLSQQIRSGRFDYPSPYWDSVGDPALDLIDSMLVVDPEKRFTVDQCLSHPWLTQQPMNVNDSTGGLVGGIAGLEVNRRATKRERTLLCHYNQVLVPEHVTAGNAKNPVKVFNPRDRIINVPREQAPSAQRAPAEFMEMGGKGDQVLYPDHAKGKGR